MLLPDSTLTEVDDSYALMPLDRPREFARLIREFVRALLAWSGRGPPNA